MPTPHPPFFVNTPAGAAELLGYERPDEKPYPPESCIAHVLPPKPRVTSAKASVRLADGSILYMDMCDVTPAFNEGSAV